MHGGADCGNSKLSETEFCNTHSCFAHCKTMECHKVGKDYVKNEANADEYCAGESCNGENQVDIDTCCINTAGDFCYGNGVFHSGSTSKDYHGSECQSWMAACIGYVKSNAPNLNTNKCNDLDLSKYDRSCRSLVLETDGTKVTVTEVPEDLPWCINAYDYASYCNIPRCTADGATPAQCESESCPGGYIANVANAKEYCSGHRCDFNASVERDKCCLRDTGHFYAITFRYPKIKKGAFDWDVSGGRDLWNTITISSTKTICVNAEHYISAPENYNMRIYTQCCSNTGQPVCHQHEDYYAATWAEANDFCRSIDKRLCSWNELAGSLSSSCSSYKDLSTSFHWSQDSCDPPAPPSPAPCLKTDGVKAVKRGSTTYPTRTITGDTCDKWQRVCSSDGWHNKKGLCTVNGQKLSTSDRPEDLGVYAPTFTVFLHFKI